MIDLDHTTQLIRFINKWTPRNIYGYTDICELIRKTLLAVFTCSAAYTFGMLALIGIPILLFVPFSLHSTIMIPTVLCAGITLFFATLFAGAVICSTISDFICARFSRRSPDVEKQPNIYMEMIKAKANSYCIKVRIT